jgi:hypothetical protein
VKPVYAEPPWDQLLCTEKTGVWFLQVKLAKVSYIRTLFKVRFMQYFGLFRVRFRQVSLYQQNEQAPELNDHN